MHSHYRNMAFATRFVRGLKSSNAIQLRQCSQILQHQKLPLVAATRGEALSSESHQDHMKAYGEEHRRFHSAEYERVFKRAIDHPDEFWGEQAEKLTWFRKWDKVLDDSDSPFTQWFVGGEMNTCYNAVDRHVERGFGNQVAIIHDSPVTKKVAMISFRQLQQKVARLAGVLVKHGVQKGDRVLIYMPMIPEAVITMLACARIGAIHSLVFGGFAAREVAVRLNHAKAVVVVSANCGVEPSRIVNYKSIVDEAIEISDHKPDKCIIFNRPEMEDAPLIPGRDLSWEEEMEKARHHDCIPVLATDPIYILYTSGTTGTPKAVVRPSGDHAVVLNWSMEALYGIKPHEVWWANSDLGWVVGHSYICYAPLLAGNTTVIYEGKPVGTPDSGALFRVIHDHDCAAMFIAPTALRAVRREDTEIQIGSRYTLKKLRSLFVAGEHCDHETLDWAKWAFRVPVLDNWWQTETGWAITASCVGLRNSLYPPHGVSGMPVPGYNVKYSTKWK
ncbi:PREDICTED: acyl-CoA synthetase short-chain family member 3, mitochondrial-like [Priapulus caudatus]|uniref:Acyl-CoA synthetase short-chain family member 3, mitochondrial n=1 Tax=Priapulus caudatus TaxID=37621 RepID=A0ABM1EMM7_PRICU|nr:PREDICTED: acyl-CoA synthetase short-chain family member 3, mitochondrial-like [Priapulus caudatus]